MSVNQSIWINVESHIYMYVYIDINQYSPIQVKSMWDANYYIIQTHMQP